MCCALSRLPLSQFMRGQVNRFKTDERELASRMSKSIFKLVNVHEVLQFIYSKMWRSPGMSELRVIVKLTVAE